MDLGPTRLQSLMIVAKNITSKQGTDEATVSDEGSRKKLREIDVSMTTGSAAGKEIRRVVIVRPSCAYRNVFSPNQFRVDFVSKKVDLTEFFL